MGYQRTRSRTRTDNRGYAWYENTGNPISGSGGTINLGYDYFTDWAKSIGESDNQYLDAQTYQQTGGVINKKGVTSHNSVFQNYYGTVFMDWGNFPHHTSLPGSPSNAKVAAEAAARTNPSGAYVDVPVAVLELADVTSLLKRAGETIIKRSANFNVALQFGVAPLIGDAMNLFNFQDQLDRRLQQLRKLQSDKGSRKTTKHGTYSASGTYDKVVQSAGVYIKMPFHANTKEEVRCHTRWVPHGNFRQLGDDAKRALAMKALTGMTIDFSTLWEIMPWSWLLDWAGNVGSFFQANRNIVPASLASNPTVIRHTRTDYSMASKSEADWSLSQARITRESKSRRSYPVVPSAHFPVLNGKQMGIISSLAILSMR